MITVIAKLTAQDGKADEMKAALERMVRSVDQDEPGVQQYTLYQQADNAQVFYFVEQYPDQDVLAQHRETPHMRDLGQALRDLSAGRAEITRLEQVAAISR